MGELFPTTIGGATKVYRYQHIMPAPAPENNNNNNHMPIKTRKYTPRGLATSVSSSSSSTSTSSSSSSSSSASSTSSTLSSISAPYNVDQSQSVQRRNARERNRVKQVNNSFARLRQHIPQSIIADLTKGGGRGPHKKISKVDTLRIAVEYIRRLQDLVDDLNGGPSASSSNLSQQFNFCLDESSSHSSSSSSHSSSNLYYTTNNNSSSNSSSHVAPATAPTPPTPLQQQQQLQRQQFNHQPLTPITLNGNVVAAPPTGTITGTTCHSPTSSFNSSMSFDSGTFEAAPQQLSPPTTVSTIALDGQLQMKFEPYEHFQLDEEDCTPDDEEILDYISLWQEQ
ncbi:uncharacterized protein Dwil_GK25270 [Drosophila willistoni]|uniref:BHLH domain-containing protein n=2 Tax=Drosophila willistoni TaxID=7260 RepID=B4NEK3_DROWI|nr:uncharacterized protein Dwil_GK25270 [Drosophila willistoni]